MALEFPRLEQAQEEHTKDLATRTAGRPREGMGLISLGMISAKDRASAQIMAANNLPDVEVSVRLADGARTFFQIQTAAHEAINETGIDPNKAIQHARKGLEERVRVKAAIADRKGPGLDR